MSIEEAGAVSLTLEGKTVAATVEDIARIFEEARKHMFGCDVAGMFLDFTE